jgi:hypothetical protein
LARVPGRREEAVDRLVKMPRGEIAKAQKQRMT